MSIALGEVEWVLAVIREAAQKIFKNHERHGGGEDCRTHGGVCLEAEWLHQGIAREANAESLARRFDDRGIKWGVSLALRLVGPLRNLLRLRSMQHKCERPQTSEPWA